MLCTIYYQLQRLKILFYFIFFSMRLCYLFCNSAVILQVGLFYLCR